ncbi:MAG: hypothetical protein E4H36_02035 [Spirochaetales bacterium]|nr:MAG: hypothetical protein E4H36_02035 [Spirochaetales bacterium]
MKKFFLIPVLISMFLVPAAADRHPYKSDIEAYISGNSLDSRVAEIAGRTKAESMALNQQGYSLYAAQKYDAALEKFRQAVSADDGNSIAYYNAACVMALQYAAGAASDDELEALVPAIVRYLYQAAERDWFWALQMMADSDLDAVKFYSGDILYGTEMRRTLSSDYEWGDVYNALNPDGSAVNYSNRQDYSDSDMGSGYYCIIGPYVFEYMPFAFWGIGQPPEENAVYFFPIDDFFEGGYGK